MSRFTRIEIDHNVGQIVLYLIAVSAFLVYKLIYHISIEYLIILSSCVIGIFTTYRTGNILKKAISNKGYYQVNFLDNVLTRFALMVILGALSFYLVFYKGIYGLLELTNEFSWFLLVFRISIIVIGAKMIHSLDKLQTGFKLVTSGDYNVE